MQTENQGINLSGLSNSPFEETKQEILTFECSQNSINVVLKQGSSNTDTSKSLMNDKDLSNSKS